MADVGTLRSIFGRENPHNKRAQVIGSVAENSGFAKPYMAYLMGKEMAAGEEWDANKESASAQQAQQQEANNLMSEAIKMAMDKETGPAAATAWLTSMVKNFGDSNPYIAKMEGIGIPAPPENGWQAFTNNKTGEIRKVNIAGLLEAKKNGEDVSEESEAFKKNMIVISPGRKAAPKTRRYQKGGMEVSEEWDESTGSWKEIGKGPKWSPNGNGGGSNGNAGNKPRKPGIIAKDIATTAAKISRAKESLASLQGKEDPALPELNAAMEALKAEYKAATGKEWANQSGNTNPAPAAKSTTPTKRAMSETDARKALAAKGITGANQDKYITMYKNAGAVK